MSRYDDRQYRRSIRRTGRRRVRGGYPVMIAQLPYEPAAWVALAALARFLFRHRSAFTPFWIAVSSFAISAIAHARHPMAWIVTAGFTLAAGLVLAMPHRLIWTHPAGRPHRV